MFTSHFKKSQCNNQCNNLVYSYRRRQHRLEQEQADLEYEIRLLMAQPERNKTDSDKEKEEALIARLVEVRKIFQFQFHV